MIMKLTEPRSRSLNFPICPLEAKTGECDVIRYLWYGFASKQDQVSRIALGKYLLPELSVARCLLRSHEVISQCSSSRGRELVVGYPHPASTSQLIWWETLPEDQVTWPTSSNTSLVATIAVSGVP